MAGYAAATASTSSFPSRIQRPTADSGGRKRIARPIAFHASARLLRRTSGRLDRCVARRGWSRAHPPPGAWQVLPDQLGLLFERIRHGLAVFLKPVQAADEEKASALHHFG